MLTDVIREEIAAEEESARNDSFEKSKEQADADYEREGGAIRESQELVDSLR